MPPASETTSGRLATANSARISDAVMPAVRAANRSTGRPGSIGRAGRPERLRDGHEGSSVGGLRGHSEPSDRTTAGRTAAATTVRV